MKRWFLKIFDVLAVLISFSLLLFIFTALLIDDLESRKKNKEIELQNQFQLNYTQQEDYELHG